MKTWTQWLENNWQNAAAGFGMQGAFTHNVQQKNLQQAQQFIACGGNKECEAQVMSGIKPNGAMWNAIMTIVAQLTGQQSQQPQQDYSQLAKEIEKKFSIRDGTLDISPAKDGRVFVRNRFTGKYLASSPQDIEANARKVIGIM